MNDLESLKERIRAAERELYDIKASTRSPERLGSDKEEYLELEKRITDSRKQINEYLIYIKKTYAQLLTIRSGAELLARKNPESYDRDLFEKTHRAFMLLINMYKKLDNEINKCKSLLYRREELVEKRTVHLLIDKKKAELENLYNSLREKESEESRTALVKNKIIANLLKNQSDEAEKDAIYEELQQFSDEKLKNRTDKLCICGSKRIIRHNEQNNSFFFGCTNFDGDTNKHKTVNALLTGDEKKKIIQKLKRKKELEERLGNFNIPVSDNELSSFYRSIIDIGEYPSLRDEKHKNYLFQSLAVPRELAKPEHLNELRDYSRFRIFTSLPSTRVDDGERIVYSLALRLMNKGVVVGIGERLEAKIRRYFDEVPHQAFTSVIGNYLTYRTPYSYGNAREESFAQYYLPKVLGNSWASYVYPQMPLELLVSEKDKPAFTDARVDFLICKGNKRIVVEIDGGEHDKINDKRRDEALSGNGYEIIRFSNDEVDRKSPHVLTRLNDYLDSVKDDSSLTSYNPKVLIATKITHQVAIAIIKMLEEGHIPTYSHLSLEISTDLFSEEEKQLLLILAEEEVRELVGKFSALYDAQIQLDFSNENAEKYQIKIGDGDGRRNSIVIRDVTLPLDYLCSIHEFPTVMPSESAITEELLEYFLSYVFGYPKFRDGQFEAIRRTLCRKESIVLLPTGSGKSVIYQLSSMLLPGITVVVSPLRALIEDQVNNLAARGINNVAYIYSSENKDNTVSMMAKVKAIIQNHSATMLYIAPERLQIPDFRAFIREQSIVNFFPLVAIDEAHCVSEWGHDFRAAYLQIGRAARSIFKKGMLEPKMLALTGTASDNVLRDVKRDLEINEPDAIIEPESFDRAELRYSVIPCGKEEKFACIKRLITEDLPERFGADRSSFLESRGDQTASGLIFTINAKAKKEGVYDAWSIFNRLKTDIPKLSIGTYFSKKIQELDNKETWDAVIRSYAQEFKDNKCQLLVATKAFGMGIDKPNIRYVIHNSLPSSIEQYYQEVGRAGRDREHAECVMLFTTNGLHDNLLDPNRDWDHYLNETRDQADEKEREDDVSKLIYFHKNNFSGKDFERRMIFAVLNCLPHKGNDFTKLKCNAKYDIYLSKIYGKFLIKQYEEFMLKSNEEKKKIEDILKDVGRISCAISTKKDGNFVTCPDLDNHLEKLKKSSLDHILIGGILNERKNEKLWRYLISKKFDDDSLNDVAKAVIRLVTLGIITDYEYDYNTKKFTICFGSFERVKVREKYLEFVNGYSRGRVDYEATQLDGIKRIRSKIDLNFISKTVERYVDLVYDTVEKGRRRAIQSMLSLASEAAQIKESNEQDSYIRERIENYLRSDDTVTAVIESNHEAGIKEIENSYPLYADSIVRDALEEENAKKSHGYAERMLETKSDHVGLLYLRAITAIKSRRYSNREVINDIVAAYRKSGEYSIAANESLTFLVRVMNLAFNSSTKLFSELWQRLEDELLGKTLATVKVLRDNENISDSFATYIRLHVTERTLRKITGD